MKRVKVLFLLNVRKFMIREFRQVTFQLKDWYFILTLLMLLLSPLGILLMQFYCCL